MRYEDGEVAEGGLSIHYGDPMRAPIILAHALGEAEARNRELLNKARTRRKTT